MARRPNETSPTGQRSPSPTCAPACSRCAISSTRSSTRGAPTGTPPGMPSADRRSPQATSCRSSTRLTAGYQDSRWVLDAGGDVPRTRETAAAMALVDAQFLAALRRTIAHDHVQFDLPPYRALTPPHIESLDRPPTRPGRPPPLPPADEAVGLARRRLTGPTGGRAQLIWVPYGAGKPPLAPCAVGNKQAAPVRAAHQGIGGAPPPHLTAVRQQR